jgi:hypothetical protein
MSRKSQQSKQGRRQRFELRAISQAIAAAEGTDSHVERIRQLSIIRRAAAARIETETDQARAEGTSWATLGGVQGVSGQAAQRKAQRRATKVDGVSGAVSPETP